MIEYLIVKGVIALLVGAAVSTIWRHLENTVHEWIDQANRLERHPQVRKFLHGAVRTIFAVARWSKKLEDHIGVLYHATDGGDIAVCVYAEDLDPSDVPNSIMSTIKQHRRYVYTQDV